MSKDEGRVARICKQCAMDKIYYQSAQTYDLGGDGAEGTGGGQKSADKEELHYAYRNRGKIYCTPRSKSI